MTRKILFFLTLGFVILSACAPDAAPPRPQTETGSLQIWQTPVPSPTPLPPTATSTVTPAPTATPQIYVVAAGDTMLEIAFQFGLSPEKLAAANPDVSPYAMSVGQELRIPAASDEPDEGLLPPPLEATIAAPTCYATLAKGLWCFALVANPLELPLENISAEFALLDAEGNALIRQTAFLPLNVLPVGERLPLFVYFAHADAALRPQARLLTAMEVANAEERYPRVVLRNTLTQINWNGRSARVSGEAFIPVEEGDSAQVWVVATAVDADGRVVGFRRWESGGTVASGARLDFEITVASLGPAIADVWVVAEARR